MMATQFRTFAKPVMLVNGAPLRPQKGKTAAAVRMNSLPVRSRNSSRKAKTSALHIIRIGGVTTDIQWAGYF